MSDFGSYGGASAEWVAIQDAMPAPTAGQSLTELKDATNAGREKVSAEEMIPLTPLLHIDDYSIKARDGYILEARTYRPRSKPLDEKLPLVLHLHGGGFLFGSLASEDAACARIVLATGTCVLNINYRHTPEATYPTSWHDVEDAIVWAHSTHATIAFNPDRVILEGISAGAWMTASYVLAQALGNSLVNFPPICGQILMIPSLVHYDCYGPQLAKMASSEISSKEENKNAPILSSERVALFLGLLKVSNPRETDLFLNPGNANLEQVKGLPPTVMGIAGLDPLRDEALLYGQLLTEAGSVVVRLTYIWCMPNELSKYYLLVQCSHRCSPLQGGPSWISTLRPEAITLSCMGSSHLPRYRVDIITTGDVKAVSTQRVMTTAAQFTTCKSRPVKIVVY